MDNATGFYVRVRGNDGGWYAEDIANLNPRQQAEFVTTMDNEDREKWLPVILQQLCKKQSIIEELLDACKAICDGDEYEMLSALHKVEAAIARAEGFTPTEGGDTQP